MYWQRKFHLKHTLSDGNIWHGMINIEADTEEELPKEVKGTYWFSKEKEGWHGYFTLTSGKYDYRQKPSEFDPWVITNGIYRPPKPFKEITSMADAEALVHYLDNVKYEFLPRVNGVLEDDFYEVETHHW